MQALPFSHLVGSIASQIPSGGGGMFIPMGMGGMGGGAAAGGGAADAATGAAGKQLAMWWCGGLCRCRPACVWKNDLYSVDLSF